MSGKTWTWAEIKQLKEGYLRPDTTVEEIAIKINRTRNSCILMAGRLGLRKSSHRERLP